MALLRHGDGYGWHEIHRAWTRFLRSRQKEVLSHLDRQYVFVASSSEGSWSEDKKKIVMTGKGPDPSGKQVDYKTETEYVSNDKHIFKMWMGTTSGQE